MQTEHFIHVLCCQSLGRHLNEFIQFLEQSFPELKGKITAEQYPPPPIPLFLSNVLTLIQLLGLLWVILGEKLWRFIGYKNNRPLPHFVYTVQNNPFPIMIFIYLLAPNIIGKFVNSGAFEIYLNDIIIFSKLQSGHFPDKDYLIKLLTTDGLKHAG